MARKATGATSLRGAVECFLSKEKGSSWCKGLRSTGTDLHMASHTVACWFGGRVFIMLCRVPASATTALVESIVRDWHKRNLLVVEWKVFDEYRNDQN